MNTEPINHQMKTGKSIASMILSSILESKTHQKYV